MELELVTLCRSASGDPTSLTVYGAMAEVTIPRVPFDFPQCAIVARLRFQSSEYGPQKVTLKLIDPDGRMIWKSETELTLTKDDRRSSRVCLFLNMPGIRMATTGAYAIDIQLDGGDLIRSTLDVLLG